MTRLDAAYLIGLGLRAIVALPVAGYALSQIIPVWRAATIGQFRWVPLAWLASIVLLHKSVRLPDRDWAAKPLHGGWDLYYVGVATVLHPMLYVLAALLLLFTALALRSGIGWLGCPATDPNWAPLTRRRILRRWWRVRRGEHCVRKQLIATLHGCERATVRWDRDFRSDVAMSVFQIDAPDLHVGSLRAGIEKATECDRSIRSTVLGLEGVGEPTFLVVNWNIQQLDRPPEIRHLRHRLRLKHWRSRRIGAAVSVGTQLNSRARAFGHVRSRRVSPIVGRAAE